MSRFKAIKERLNAKPGESAFDPAYMYKNPNADVAFLIAVLDIAIAELANIASGKHQVWSSRAQSCLDLINEINQENE